MKFLPVLFALLSHLAPAQPGREDPFTNPCGSAPNDTIDLTHDGIPDLVVMSYRIGTDDEPSSSGTCTLYVEPLPGTGLLCDRPTPRDAVPHPLAFGDTLRRIEHDGHGQGPAFLRAQLIVMQWGYGSQAQRVTLTKGIASQVLGFQTTTEEGTVLGTFMVEPLPATKELRIKVRDTVEGAKELIVK